ncbi:DUF4124 domain-containing protein [Motilimonas cestriensis]|uniref:DUF4124 domain-containing protein n=1 Tax=Motilimonas cestriensis TaxID=2742685 RepID=A0ABS8W6D4_9GAMM|nr:DUF4124 domain-containing protein [Motilimonas cestriensis]MCE2594562.1 DUF4124 domain-containing protein [Motilimonas cestriensis]
MRILLQRFWCFACLLALLSSEIGSAQTLFSWIDEKGVIHYTDKPPAPEVRLNKRFMEFEISLETQPITANSTRQSQQVYQPVGELDDVFSLHQGLSPSCRWIAKRIALLEALMEQQASEYDQILKLEVSKRHQDWLEQGCFSAFK